VNQFKVRASYGQAGLNSLGYTDTYGGYGSTAYATGAGILRSNLANPNLLWETTETVDGGVDIGLFNGRVNLLVDVYNKLTRNRLDNLPLPAESGFHQHQIQHRAVAKPGSGSRTERNGLEDREVFLEHKLLLRLQPDNGGETAGQRPGEKPHQRRSGLRSGDRQGH
jgi:hypothetical protein